MKEVAVGLSPTSPNVRTIKTTDIGLLALIAVSVAMMLTSRAAGLNHLGLTFTVFASTGFVALGLHAGGLKSPVGRLLLTGLVFCWLGDIIGPGIFIHGLYAFLAAHCLFGAAFVWLGVNWSRARDASIAIAAVDALVVVWIWPSVPSHETIPVLLYTAVISTMVVLAMGVVRKLPIATAAAILFFASDIFVARWRYGGGPLFGYLCYPAYYCACALFALAIGVAHGASFVARPNPREDEVTANR